MMNRSRIALTLLTALALYLMAPLTASAQEGGGGAGGGLILTTTTTGPTTSLGLTIGGIVFAVRSSKSKQTALAYYLDDNRPEVQQTLALDQTLANKAELVVFQITQAAVNELG